MQKRERRIRMNWLDKRQPLVLQKDQGLSRSYLEYCKDFIDTVVRLQVSNWFLKITGKIALETNKELSKFGPNCKNANDDGQGGMENQGSKRAQGRLCVAEGLVVPVRRMLLVLPTFPFLGIRRDTGSSLIHLFYREVPVFHIPLLSIYYELPVKSQGK